MLFSIVASIAFTALELGSFWDLAKEKHSQDVEDTDKQQCWTVSPVLLGVSPGG